MILLSTLLMVGCRSCARRAAAPRDAAPFRPAPSLAALERRYAALPAATPAAARLRLAEAVKCLRLRRELAARGARAPALRCDAGQRLPRPGPGQLLVALFQLGDRLHPFVHGARGTRALPPLPRVATERLMIALRDELEFGELRPVAPLWRLLERGYRLLLAPAQAELADVDTLVVSGDGLTRFIPWHALLGAGPAGANPPGGRFVASRWAVSYLPCAALWRRGPGPRYGRAEVFVPGYGPADASERLPGGRAEAAALQGRLPRVVVHPTRRATPGRLLAALRRARTVVHYAGHGIADLTPDSPPELDFPRGQPAVGVAQVTRAPALAPLVVLGSCTTAYVARFRDDRRLTTRVNLAEALLAAGVRHVVAASWGVKDRQSAAQMRVFYRHLAAEGPAAALARAYRNRIARLRPPHPRYWGFFAVYGAGRKQGADQAPRIVPGPSPSPCPSPTPTGNDRDPGTGAAS